jgi:uncharacterized protein YndB with AHSA1/START domain
MPTSIATIEIDAPAAEVYRFLTSPRLMSEWISGLLANRPLSGDGELRLGARAWNGTQDGRKDSAVHSEIIGFEPDRSLNVRIESKGFIILTDFHLFESDGQTTVRQSVQLSYKRWHRLFAPITGRMVQRKIESDLKRLKRRAETKAARSAADKAA